MDFATQRGEHPTLDTISMAGRIVRAVHAVVKKPDIVLDDDGELSFDFRLSDGRLIMAEFTVAGKLWVGVYGGKDGSEAAPSELLMPAIEEQWLSLLGQD
jgi:hypothetical protein